MHVELAAYIIRSMLTGDTLPSPAKPKVGSAQTHVELSPPHAATPRIFPSRYSAGETLKHWLRGKRVAHKNVPQSARRADDMEIVRVKVTLEWD